MAGLVFFGLDEADLAKNCGLVEAKAGLTDLLDARFWHGEGCQGRQANTEQADADWEFLFHQVMGDLTLARGKRIQLTGRISSFVLMYFLTDWARDLAVKPSA